MSLISTAYGELALQDAAQLFSRWSQENFLRYMMQHYAIDLLNEYRTEEIPETKRPVVNPQWRELDRQRRSVKSKLTHHQARFAALTLHPQSDEAAQSKWEKRKAELVEAIEQFDHELTGINSQLKTTPSHLDWDKLPETEKFQRLAPSRKQLVDTVRLGGFRVALDMAFGALSKYDFCFVGMGFPEVGSLGMEANGVGSKRILEIADQAKSPRRILVRSLLKSRNKLREKYRELRAECKRWRNQAAAVERSRSTSAQAARWHTKQLPKRIEPRGQARVPTATTPGAIGATRSGISRVAPRLAALEGAEKRGSEPTG